MSTDNEKPEADSPPPVNRRLLLESDPHQTRVAVLEDGRLTEIHMERRKSRGVVGNVYKGRVSRILPGMQAAFVDIGLTRDAFLFVGDVRDTISDLDELAEADPQTREFPIVERRQIEELLKEGEELIVQVVKAPLPNKGARITTEITLPGRYAVFVPTVQNLGISRRIQDSDERERLRNVLEELIPEGGGLIVRTAGEGRSAADFAADVEFLAARWGEICENVRSTRAPALIHEDYDLALRTVRDRFTDDVSELLVDGAATYESVSALATRIDPGLEERIRLFEEEGALFSRLGVEREINAALKSKVWLRSGGYIVINPTEALVAIDVNTGRFVGKTNLEETVVKTNLEAVKEIVRQIRLRDLSGIIVVDLIDMGDADNRELVWQAFERELKKDRAKNQALRLSDFGLVEITRKRSRENLARILTRPCPDCGGSGRVLSIATICLNLRREVLNRTGHLGDHKLVVRVHPEVEAALRSDQHEVYEELTELLGEQLAIEADEDLAHDHYSIVEA